MCNVCNIQNAKPINLFTDAEIEKFIRGIWDDRINPQNLDKQFYKKVAGKLEEGVYKGFGKDFIETKWDTPDYNMLYDLRENVYIFSGAKQYQQVREISSLLTEGNKINSYNDFKKEAILINTRYNDNYLRTEYNSAIAQSSSASKWMDIENNAATMPMLTYRTVGDQRVRQEHKYLDGITRPVGDKFWNTYFPPNDWGCRCDVEQNDVTEKTSLKGFKPTEAGVPDLFRFNAGKSRIVFSNKHPYYKVAPKDMNLAKQNFNLPLPG